ncbi:MAG TPA: acetyl-coenzyme A synthetase N-terminal domain-containing protein, partial [Euzebya sp.]|nr:acetyl-coenzyme A synthetase N-terminal domain-containing protein [Euzebya sp.]
MADTGRDRAIAQWGRIARDLRWDHPFTAVHEGEGVPGRWFRDGRLNAATNCLDRHLPARRDQVAVHWEGEPGDRRSITYGELHEEVCAVADALGGLGVVAGDRVALYLGWIP